MIFMAALIAAMLLATRRASYGITALILVQPFDFPRYVFGTSVTLPKVVLLGVLLGLAAQTGWRDALSRQRIRTVLIALAVFTAVVGITILVAAHRAAAVRETLKWLEYLALFAAVCVAYRRDRNDRLLLRVWAATATLVMLTALVQEIIGAPSGLSMNGHIVPRIAGVLEGPNQLGGYLEISIAVFCAWSLRSRLAAATLVLALCTLALTFSRGGILGAGVAVVTILVARSDVRRAALRPVAAGVACAVLLVAAWIWIAHLPNALPPRPSVEYAGGVGYRPELWRAAIALWQRHPILGVGAGNYQLELSQAGLLGVQTHANSWYLESLSDGGIVLFLATIGLIAAVLVSLVARLQNGSPWQLAAFAGSLALAVHQVVDYMVFYPKVGGPWWILVALGVSAVAFSANGNRNQLRDRSAARIARNHL
jgi:O-antigen ligase